MAYANTTNHVIINGKLFPLPPDGYPQNIMVVKVRDIVRLGNRKYMVRYTPCNRGTFIGALLKRVHIKIGKDLKRREHDRSTQP